MKASAMACTALLILLSAPDSFAGAVAQSDAELPQGVERSFDVGGYKLRIKCMGERLPTILLDAGIGEPPIESGSWNKVATTLSETNRVCLYDRAGLGSSDKPRVLPVKVDQQVQDLHRLVTAARLDKPFVLVSHSMAGFAARVYASKFPEDLKGLVLVDSSHPDQWNRWRSAFPAENTDQPESVANGRRFITEQYKDPGKNPENFDIFGSAGIARRITSIGAIPLVVVTHSPKWRMDPQLPEDISLKLEAQWQEMQKELLSLSTDSSQLVSETAGHYVQAEDPALVVRAVNMVAKEHAAQQSAPSH